MPRNLALNQVRRIEGLCDFLEHPGVQEAAEKHVPVTMPRTVGGLSFDTSLWVGVGIVGLWASLDAYAERRLANQKCGVCSRICLEARYQTTGYRDTELSQASIATTSLLRRTCAKR